MPERRAETNAVLSGPGTAAPPPVIASGERSGSSQGGHQAAAVIAGSFQVSLREQKTNTGKTLFWDFHPDNSVWEKDKQIATWTAEAPQVYIEFSDKSWDRMVIRRKAKGLFAGTYRYQNRETWTCELQQLFIVAVWQHRTADGKLGNVTYWSNGHAGTPDGKATWSINGSHLKVRDPPWGHDSTISPDGQSYEGKNLSGAAC